ncbi:precorrin-2 dehydrogenase/sirohydrochlorin ferrochelatase family protein [Magnetococcales bacterium HHB-1]
MDHYWLEANLSQQQVLVFGGGRVARRKISGLLTCGAEITVISPELDTYVARWVEEGKIAHQKELFSESLFEEKIREKRPLLLFAVTSSIDQNKKIALLCREKGILCNSADDPKVSGFLVPATLRRPPITIAIGTQGLSPSLSRLLKERLDRLLEPGWQHLVKLFGELRQTVIKSLPTPEIRQKFWRQTSLAAEKEQRFKKEDNRKWFIKRLEEQKKQHH